MLKGLAHMIKNTFVRLLLVLAGFDSIVVPGTAIAEI